jgi:methylmalonyl-CoA mutase
MGESTTNNLFKDFFPISNKSSWEETASVELNGNEPFNELSWKDSDKLEFLPYYNSEDTKNLGYLNSFLHSSDKNTFLGNRSWINTPCILVTSETNDNKQALEHLTNGAEGLLFDLSNASNVDFYKLLNDIEWQYCFLAFCGIADEKTLQKLASFLSDSNFDPTSIHGNIFWERIPQTGIKEMFFEYPNFRTLGCFVPSSTPVDEICNALVCGVETVSQFNSDSLRNVLWNISFSVASSGNFLSDVSKLKALRILWYQVSQAFQIIDYKPSDLHIHFRAQYRQEENFKPHGSMLSTTTASMAAILGGCSSLTVFPENENNTMMVRIARNVSNILREESHFNKVADPIAGSFAIDAMVDQMAQHAWKLFQSKISK